MTGRFVVVEGPEGAGKSTLVERLAQRVRSAGRTVVAVREPGGTDAAEAARGVVLDPRYEVTPAAELFLLLAARADLVTKVIRPALARGAVVVSDRFDLSTVAYQVAGRGLEAELVRAANQLATGGVAPDLTLVLDVPREVARERQAGQGKRPDRMEQADDGFHARVREAFRTARGPGVVHLDGSRRPEQVEEEAWRQVERVIGNTVAQNGL